MRSALVVAAMAVTSSSTLFSISSAGLRTWSPAPFCSFAFLRNRGRSNLVVIAISLVVYEVGTAPRIVQPRGLHVYLYAPKAYPSRPLEPCGPCHAGGSAAFAGGLSALSANPESAVSCGEIGANPPSRCLPHQTSIDMQSPPTVQP